MLLPRFSLRTMLIVTAICGGFFLIVASAIQGHPWAVSLTVAVAGVFLTFLIYAAFLAAALLIAAVNPFRPRAAIRSPFAQHVAAPQLVPQDDEL